MKALNELNVEQLNYLRQKWASEVKELDREILRTQNRLVTRVDKQSIDSAHVASLKTALDNAKKLLEHLKTAQAPTEMINIQQLVVVDAQKLYDEESMGLNILTDEEAQLQQTVVDELKLRKSYRETKLSSIDTLLAA